MQPNTHDIVAAIFGPDFDPKTVHFASFPGDPHNKEDAKFYGFRASGRMLDGRTIAPLNPDNNNFIVMGALDPTKTGRSLADVTHHVAFWMDDVGTKVPIERVQQLIENLGLKPTLVIETSPGNFSYIWRFDAPVEELPDDLYSQTVAAIRYHLKADGWGDPAAQDAARDMRLPGLNGKKAYNGFHSRVVEFRPEHSVSVDRAAFSFMGANWLDEVKSGKFAPAKVLAGASNDRAATMDDPLVKLAAAVGLNPQPSTRAGVIDCTCPNGANHTGGDQTGYAIINDGMSYCNHASCQHLRSPDFQDMMIEMYDRQVQAGVMFGTIVDTGTGLADAKTGEVVPASGAGLMASVRFENAPVDATQLPMLAAPLPVVPQLLPVAPFNPRSIHPRRWLYGSSFIAGYVSMLVAPGGSGKSALILAEAIAMASGREVLSGKRPVRPLRVWVHNAEDDIQEMRRRLAATLGLHGLSHADLKGNLILTSGRDLDIKLARQTSNGLEIDRRTVENMIGAAKAADVDVIVLDPLGALHTLPENSNEAANLLAGALRQIAHETGAAVVLLHHASKVAAMDMDTAGVSASRGASAFTDMARDVRQLVRMTETEAGKFGITPGARRSYFRVENGKANMALAADARWIKIVGVPLNNGMGLWPLGDVVGAAQSWTPPGPVVGTVSDLLCVQQAISAASVRPRASNKSPEWIGYLVGSVLALDIGKPSSTKETRTAEQVAARAKVDSMIGGWLEDGGLRVVKDQNPAQRRGATFIEAGEPAMPFGDDEHLPKAA